MSSSINSPDNKSTNKNTRRFFLPRWLLRCVIQASFVLIFFLALAWGMSYWVVGWLPSQQNQLANLISGRVGVPVKIHSLHSYIKDTRVGVRITELQLHTPRMQAPNNSLLHSGFLNSNCQTLSQSFTQRKDQKKNSCILRIGKLNAELDWLQSAWQFRPVYSINLNDVEVDLNAFSQRDRTQDVWQSLRTWWDQALALPWQDHVVALLGAQDRIHLNQARLFGSDTRQQHREWIISNAYTQWRGNFHDIKAKVFMRSFEEGNIEKKRTVEMPMTVTAQLNGRPEKQNEISAVLQVKAKAIPLQSFLPPMQIPKNKIGLPSTIHAAGFWLEIKNGSLHRLAASWRELDTLNTPMRWVLQRQNTWDWLFQVYWQEKLKNKNQHVKDHRISGRYTRLSLPNQKQQGYLSVLIDNWDVDQFRKGSFLQQWLSNRINWLDTWQLKGKIRQAHILIPVEESLSAWTPQFDSFSWRMHLQNVAFERDELAVSKLNIIALGNANRGLAQIKQNGGVLSIPIFRSPLHAVNTVGKAYWIASENNFKKGWTIDINDLDIQQPVGRTTGSIRFSTQPMYRKWVDHWTGKSNDDKQDKSLVNTSFINTPSAPVNASSNEIKVKKPTIEELSNDLHFGKLSLNLLIENADGSQTSLFLPKQLPKNLLKWLDQSIKSGTLDSGRLVMEGLLAMRTQELNSRLKESELERSQWNELRQKWRSLMNTQFNFGIQNGELLFDPKWPLLTQANGAINIHRNIVNVDVVQAQLGDLPLGKTHIHVSPVVSKLSEKTSILHRPPIQVDIEAYTQGEISELISFLQKMPVQSVSASLWKTLEIKGQYDGQAKIKFQIASKKMNSAPVLKPQVNVDLAISRAELKVPIASLIINDLYGKLSFSMTEGLKAQRLAGQWLEQPVIANILPASTGDTNAAGLIRLYGKQRFSALPWIKQPWMKHAKGVTNFTAELAWFNAKKIAESRMDNNQHPLSLRVQTNWKGVAFNWPEPLQKSAQESWPFELRFIPGNRAQKNASFWFARWINNDGVPLGSTQFNQDKNALAGAIRFGSRTVSAPPLDRIKVEGKIKQLDVLAWQTWLAQQNIQKNNKSASPSNSKSKIETLCKYVHSIDVKLDALKIWNQTVNQFDLTAQCSLSSNQIFAGSVQHPELSANWSLSNNSKSLDLSVPHINLSAWTDRWKTYQESKQKLQTQKTQKVGNFWQEAATTWPNIRLKTDQILWRESNWGAWEANITPDTLWKVSNIKASTHAMKIVGNLEWSPEKNYSRTIAQSTFKNAKDVMQAWGYPPTVLSKKGTMDIDMSWSGAPWQIKIAKLNGNLNMNIKNGQLLAVDNAASVKALGLLNLSTLQKRLQLDFRDVYLKGLPFETLGGNFQLQEGWLENKKFALEGSSANFKAVGKVNLETKEISQQITASLPLSDNLILPAAVVGGLPAAATAYVLNKALGDQLDKLTTLRFRVGGEWSDPQVESVRLFD